MIHFPLSFPQAPSNNGRGRFRPHGIPPRTNIAPYRGVRAWNGLDGPVPVRGTAQGTCVPAVPSRPHGGTFCKQNL